LIQYHKNIHKTNIAVWLVLWIFLWYWIKQPSWSYECFCDIESNSHPGLMHVYVILNQTAMLVLWMFLWYWIKQPSWSYECFCDIKSNSHLDFMNVFVILNQNHKNIHMTKMAVWFNITKTFTRPRWLFNSISQTHS
jgi:hypothetical protein